MYPCANNRNNSLTNISNSKPSQPFFHFNSSGYTQGLQLFILLEPSYTIDQCSSLFSISPSELQECCLFNTTLEHRLFGGSLLFIFLLFCIVLYFVFLVLCTQCCCVSGLFMLDCPTPNLFSLAIIFESISFAISWQLVEETAVAREKYVNWQYIEDMLRCHTH